MRRWLLLLTPTLLAMTSCASAGDGMLEEFVCRGIPGELRLKQNSDGTVTVFPPATLKHYTLRPVQTDGVKAYEGDGARLEIHALGDELLWTRPGAAPQACEVQVIIT